MRSQMMIVERVTRRGRVTSTPELGPHLSDDCRLSPPFWEFGHLKLSIIRPIAETHHPNRQDEHTQDVDAGAARPSDQISYIIGHPPAINEMHRPKVLNHTTTDKEDNSTDQLPSALSTTNSI